MTDYTILIIDYDPRNIERFSTLFSDAGYRVEVANDGLTGLEAFKTMEPDLVLTEAMIPRKHGFEVCQEIKKTPQGKQTPVIIITAVYKGRKYRTQALHLYGCDEYIEKPVEDDRLVEVCLKLLKDKVPKVAGKEPAVKLQAPAEPAAENDNPIDDTEEEIISRLDAIMPDDDGSSRQKAATGKK